MLLTAVAFGGILAGIMGPYLPVLSLMTSAIVPPANPLAISSHILQFTPSDLKGKAATTSVDAGAISEPAVPEIPHVPPSLRTFIDRTATRMLDPVVNASSTGTAPSGTMPEICTGLQSNRFGCYENYYRALVAAHGIPAAFTDIKARYPTNSYVQAECHPLMHIIGQAAVLKYPNIADAYLNGDSFCWSGYYHGVLEGVAFKMGKDKMFASLNTLCDGIPGKATYSFDYYNCVHGVGHGVMEITNDELFESLTDCDVLTGSWERTSCYSGVFMENIILTTDKDGDRTTKYLKPHEPLYPCTAVGEPYKGSCYLMQTSYALTAVGGDFSRVFQLCSAVEQPYRDICYQSLGRDASGRSTSNAAATKATCYLGKDDEQISNCVIGAVKDFVSDFHSDVQAGIFCDSLDLKFQTICSSTAESYYQSFK